MLRQHSRLDDGFGQSDRRGVDQPTTPATLECSATGDADLPVGLEMTRRPGAGLMLEPYRILPVGTGKRSPAVGLI